MNGKLNMPQTHIGTISPDRLQERRLMIRHWFKVASRIWEIVGDGKVGLALLDRFWSGKDPWVTADYVTAVLKGALSDDTVRRRLNELVDKGAALKRREGRQFLYALRPSYAEEIARDMENGPRTADCGNNLLDSRNLRENLVVIGPYETHTALISN